MKYFKLTLLALILTSINAFAQTDAVKDKYIIPYLDQVTAWHRGVKAIEVSPNNAEELLLNSSLRKSADKTLTSAFNLAKAEAAAIAPRSATTDVTDSTSTKAKLQQYIDAANKDSDDLAAQLESINSQISIASGDARAALILKRKTLESGSKLIKARQDLLQNVVSMSGKTTVDEGGLIGQINNLARTIPEIQNEDQKSPTAPVKNETNITLPQNSSNTESAGIIGLGEDLYSALIKQKDIRNLLALTAKLHENNQEIMDNLRTELKSKVEQGNAIADGISKTADADIAAQKTKLDTLTVDFKLLSNIILPLNQTNAYLDSSKKTLESWNNFLVEETHKTLRRLGIHLAFLAVAIAIPLFLSHLANKATQRYVKDPKRQRQLRTVRRVVFGIIIGLVIFLNLISEYGSLITFAGFLTAGIAVALQTLILSLVAHFFFIGRYAVKVGDQISIGGATGEVIKVGMIRFYVMELSGTDFNLNPTGRIVIYPNSVLFQPAAFTKLMPGTSYTWSEIKLKLDPSTNYDLADTKLNEAVTKVYSAYTDIMRRQEQALQQATHYGVKIPAPKTHLRVTDAGFIFLIRYAIEISKAPEIKDRFTKELLETIRQNPGLKLA